MRKSQTPSFKIFDASKFKVGLVCAQFNSDITEKILDLALKKLKDYGITPKNIRVERVAGSVEIPVILQTLARTKKYNCLIAIGVVIKGETGHYDYVAKIVSEGVLRVTLDYNLPVGFAVLTTPDKKLARSRVGIGAGAAEAALRSAALIKGSGC